jgi:type II secretory pathway pseudopilin PulG
MNNFDLKKNRGFTLLEALVAISILMVAVVAPITIAQKGLSSAVYTKNQMIASYLAQDAIEFIINKKDTVAINNIHNGTTNGWLDDLVDCVDETGDIFCAIDTVEDGGMGLVMPDDEGTFLKKDSNGFYRYDSGTPTNFKRSVNIIENGDKALVTVKVSWGDEKVEVKTLIYNY